MKREKYSKVKVGSKVKITIGIYNKDRECDVVCVEKEHVVLHSCDGKRFYGGKSLDCPFIVMNMHDIDLIEEEF